MLSQKQLLKFKQIFKENFEVEISDVDTVEKASKLLELYKSIYGNPFDYKNNENKNDIQ